ncbi:SAM-dependent methyltransferase [Gorillibacterium timonense]|uniref:SAM-dependent methyltransferase n=1 Tax=Gorillibacterium timonense TaxID=1689269 RepID=UPI00071CD018|nr:SAM-dependent methyltransferase [Gorillibacterium timonense]
MDQFVVNRIGKVRSDENGMRLELEKAYIPALTNLEGFGYIQVLWWFDQCDNKEARAKLVEPSPYKGSPHKLGTFATRSPERPNPLALTCVHVTYVDMANGVIGLAYIDAEDGSPVLDIKPYTPSLDRVEKPIVPDWCADWPQSVETSGEYDWGKVFQF